MRSLLAAILILSGHLSFADEPRGDLSAQDRKYNFAIVYAVQWAIYLGDQHDVVWKHGSFRNWLLNPFSPHLDRDGLEHNVIRHSLSGHLYYLFYRARGETRRQAFLFSSLSSAAFEFTIETATERPSYQDLLITPTFGTTLGIGIESLSEYLRSRQNRLIRVLGTLMNPLSLLPNSKSANDLSATTLFYRDYAGLHAVWSF